MISTIQVGGHEAWRLDVEIPWKHGIWQPVGDSVGPGGLSRALRTVPVMLAIARDMEVLCPRTWLINYTNPLSVLCRAVHRETTIRVAGLGTSIPFYAERFARVLGVEPEGVSLLAAGLNRFSWLVDLRYRGEDAYPLLRRKAAAWKDGEPSISAELLDAFGLLPLPSGNHVAEFLPWFLGPETGHGERYGLRDLAPWQELADEKASFVARMAEYRETGRGLEDFFAEPLEQGGAIDLVDAIANNRLKPLQETAGENSARRLLMPAGDPAASPDTVGKRCHAIEPGTPEAEALRLRIRSPSGAGQRAPHHRAGSSPASPEGLVFSAGGLQPPALRARKRNGVSQQNRPPAAGGLAWLPTRRHPFPRNSRSRSLQ